MNIVRVFDVETTGLDPKEHKVIEIAAFDVNATGIIESVGSYLVNPGRSISPEASAVHHLLDADVSAAQSFDAVWANYTPNAPAFYAAHNCEFEEGYIPTPQGTRWICTHKCALRAWDDAPAFSNQVLRYWLKFDSESGFDRKVAAQAHRAEPDAYVTAWLLARLLTKHTLDELLKWSGEPKVFPKITFGKHRNLKWAEVPADYLGWMRDGSHQLEEGWRLGAKVELERRSTSS